MWIVGVGVVDVVEEFVVSFFVSVEYVVEVFVV